MGYKELDDKSVIEYVLSIDAINNFFQTKELSAKEIGDGNLNFVYIISSKLNPEKSLILKQAVPYLRCVGEEFPLSKDRMTYEIRALREYEKISPKLVPKIYHDDIKMSLIIMQNLDQHIIMRKGLIQATKYPKFAKHISEFLANNLFKTSSLCLSSKEKRSLIDKFNSNTELCKITEDFVFSFAFMENETNNIDASAKDHAQDLFNDMEFKKGVLDLKYIFMNQTDALIHGDLHTGSIMINQNETYVIDPEFAFIGPFGFDIGALIGNLVMSYISHFYRSNDRDFQEWILQTIDDFYVNFENIFLSLWKKTDNSALLIDGFIDQKTLHQFQQQFIKNIIQQSVGFAGCKIARRIYGIAGVEDIRGIEDLNSKNKAQIRVLEIAKEFVKKYQSINSSKDIIAIIKKH